MSRTYKDSDAKYGRDIVEYKKSRVLDKSSWWYKSVAGSRTKKKRSHLEFKHYWMKQTPSWFIRMFMNRPERHKARVLEKLTHINNLEDLDFPDLGKKPHKYYW